MLYVSCQPYKNESYYTQVFILNMAKAAIKGGAKGLRIEGIENINYVKANVEVPIIGLVKNKTLLRERYISPTIKEIEDLLKTNCDYLAIDFTLRDNIDKKYYQEISEHIHRKGKCKIVADISNLREAELAYECNVDFISSSLRGYTLYTDDVKLPDIGFIKKLYDKGFENIIAEGGYSTHSEYENAIKSGAKMVVIGTAITRPHLIVRKIITGNY